MSTVETATIVGDLPTYIASFRRALRAANRSPKTVVPEEPVPVITDDELKALLRACEGRSFDGRRDTALIRLLVDTGMRRGELMGLALGDLDLDRDVAIVLGKGRRPRSCPFGTKTAMALDRYLRARGKHPLAQSDALWLGRRGPLTETGLKHQHHRGGGRLLRHGEFNSTDELAACIVAFIRDYNRHAQPFRWTYDGRLN